MMRGRADPEQPGDQRPDPEPPAILPPALDGGEQAAVPPLLFPLVLDDEKNDEQYQNRYA